MDRKLIINGLFILAVVLIVGNIIIQITAEQDLTYLYPLGLLAYAFGELMRQADRQRKKKLQNQLENRILECVRCCWIGDSF